MRPIEALQKNRMLIICICVLFVLIICPLAFVFGRAVIVDGRPDLSYAVAAITDSDNLTTIKNSLVLGLSVVALSTFIAAPLAFLTARTEFAKYRWIDIVVMVPFMTPPYISSMGWILFMQKNGLFQQMFPFTGGFSESFFHFGGLVLVMSLHMFPFMYTMLKNALLNVNSNLEEAGALFGGDFGYRMRRIMIPLVTGNYAIGALLVFVKTLSEYGTPATLGQRIGFYVFTTDIHRHSTTAPIDFGKAASLSSVLVGICLMMWWLQNYITNQKTYRLVSGKGVRVLKKPLRPAARWGAWGYLALLLVIAIGVPYFSVIATSLIKLRGYGLAAGNFTFAHYVELFAENPKGRNAIWTSLYLAVGAATICAVLGTVITVAIHYGKTRLKKTVEAIALLPEMLPGIVMVIGLMLFWNKIYTWIPLYNTVGIMVLAYVVLYLPYTVQYVTSSFSQINDSLIQAGRVFGGSGLYIFRKITFPLVIKGVATGWMMTFIISFRELVAASMMAPPSTLTISTFIVREFEQGSVSVGMAMAVLCVALTTGILIFLNRAADTRPEP